MQRLCFTQVFYIMCPTNTESGYLGKVAVVVTSESWNTVCRKSEEGNEERNDRLQNLKEKMMNHSIHNLKPPLST